MLNRRTGVLMGDLGDDFRSFMIQVREEEATTSKRTGATITELLTSRFVSRQGLAGYLGREELGIIAHRVGYLAVDGRKQTENSTSRERLRPDVVPRLFP